MAGMVSTDHRESTEGLMAPRQVVELPMPRRAPLFRNMTFTSESQPRTWRVGAASVAAVALTAASVMLGGTAAHAADQQLGPDDIAGFEIGSWYNSATGEETPNDDFNYDQWHVGSIPHPGFTSEDSLEFGECSLTVLAVPEGADTAATVTQVLKGFPMDQRPSTLDDIRQAIESVKIDVESGTVTLQFPFFSWKHEANAGHPPVWEGTWRSAEPLTGGTGSVFGDTPLVNSNGSGPSTLDQILANYEDRIATAEEDEAELWFELLGIGFTGSPGTVINSISFLGSTYTFGTGDCDPAPVLPEPEEPVVPVQPTPPVAVETGIR